MFRANRHWAINRSLALLLSCNNCFLGHVYFTTLKIRSLICKALVSTDISFYVRKSFSKTCTCTYQLKMVHVEYVQMYNVYVIKQNPDRNGYLICLLNILPVSHWYPFHPAAQPPSHRPVTWLQTTLFKQCPIHRCVQLIPYQPPSHTVNINGVRFIGAIYFQHIINHSFSNII